MSERKDQSQLLQTIVEIIIEEANPEQVILFGSRAKGTAQEESDYDFLVVVRGIQNEREISRRIYRALLASGLTAKWIIAHLDHSNASGPGSVICVCISRFSNRSYLANDARTGGRSTMYVCYDCLCAVVLAELLYCIARCSVQR